LNARSGPARVSIEELRRAELVDATVRTMAARGFEGTTVRDIARAAGASPASVLYYFSSKDELLAAAFAEADQRFRARVRDAVAGLEPAPTLVRIVELCFPDDASEDPTWSLEIDLWAAAPRRDELREIFETASADWLELIAAAVETGVRDGKLRVSGSPRDEAMAFAALVDGLAVHTRVTKHVDVEAARRILLGHVDALRAPSQSPAEE
jgi:AcrR family transcriptional regulator